MHVALATTGFSQHLGAVANYIGRKRPIQSEGVIIINNCKTIDLTYNISTHHNSNSLRYNNPIPNKMIDYNGHFLEPKVMADGPSSTPKVNFNFVTSSSGSGKSHAPPARCYGGEERVDGKKAVSFKTKEIGFCPACRELWSCISCEEWFANWHELKIHFSRAHSEQIIG
ncbi:hypothetical protein LA080_013060 [Diaporthe eres]|nr:hypothetical protein LA080_013060 [Diaporthe eres]